MPYNLSTELRNTLCTLMVKRILILFLIHCSAYSRLGPLQLLYPSSRNLFSNTMHSTRDETGQMDAVTGGGNSESEEAPSLPSAISYHSAAGSQQFKGARGERVEGENCMNSGHSL